jgi:AraC-like DNA-binding protein
LAVYHGRFGRATLYELDRPMTTHAHREGHLIFFLGGEPGRVVVSGRGVDTAPKVAAAISPWESHGFEPGSAGSAGLFLVLYISPSWFQDIGAGHQRSLRFGSSGIPLTAPIELAVDRVANLLITHKPAANIDQILFDLTELCRIQSWWIASEAPSAAQAKPDLVDYRVRKSIRILSERYSDDPDLDAVARESGLSRPHFYKLFREQTGVTPSVYLNTLRMEHAVAMVAAAERSITVIGETLGFSCQSVFTRFFTSHVGMAPSDYRCVARVLSV